MERDTFPFTIAGETLNFNSHAHVERDNVGYRIGMAVRISTHTLTWSVTCCGRQFMRLTAISTHTLTWSVTDFSISQQTNFQISTHTLTWSVTSEPTS